MTEEKPAQSWTINKLLLTAFLVRLLLVFYARIHDYVFQVKFTDVDYHVFSDAAEHVVNGRSPYDRTTYRYTPVLAWLLTPNVTVNPDFGKLLFCAVDILTAYLLWKLAAADAARRPKQEKEAFLSQFKLHLSLLWLFNPLTAIISSRGNADALVCAAVLASLHLLHKGEWILSAIVHGAVAIHLKLYPIIYLPAIFLHLAQLDDVRGFRLFIVQCLTNLRGFIFTAVSLLFFTASVCVGFQIYGSKFMEEYLFYHVSRNDIRHNFSPYFYPLYLAMGDERTTAWLSRGAFVPQAACVLLFALKYHRDLPFCMFLTTFTFVALNKVCTSQYFVWYLCFLPLICNRINLCRTRAVILAFLWFFGQACWLLPAYLLEFRGWNTFHWIWIASMLFLAINFYIVVTLTVNYIPPEPAREELAKKKE